MKEQLNINKSIDYLEIKNQSFLNKIRQSKYTKTFMAFVGINMLSQIVFPTTVMALTAGASSPEFSSFEPVATTNMVNDFTGDFTYNLPILNIPGPDGGGYSMSLSYHSGASPEEEASWVGFGWTLNPGAINRNKRGYADDFNAVDIIKYNKVKPNWTSGSTFDFTFEVSSNDQETDRKEREKAAKAGGSKFNFNGFQLGGIVTEDATNEGSEYNASVSLSNAIRYNNYSGFSQVKGFGAGAMGIASLNMNRSGGESTFGFSIRPMAFLGKKLNKKAKKLKEESIKLMCPQKYKRKLLNKSKLNDPKNILRSSYSSWSFSAPAVPYSVAKNTGIAYNVSYSVTLNPVGPVGFQFGIKGSMNAQANEAKETKKAYGYLHNPSKTQYLENDNIEADYQIEKPSTFDKHDKNLGIPFNNADMFSATGNGVIGGFQIHHDKIGQYYPSFITNKQQIKQLGVELGIGGTLQIGLDVGVGFQKTKVRDWTLKLINNATLRDLIEAGFTIEDINEIFGTQISISTGNNVLDTLLKNIPEFASILTDAFDLSPISPNLIEEGGYSKFMQKIDNYFSFGEPSNAHMRFNGDMGSELSYSNNDELSFAKIGGTVLAPYLNMEDFTSGKLKLNNNEKRTSYIEYSSYDSNGNLIEPLDILYVENKDSSYSDLIGQIAITDKSGNKSTYGLPVFTKEETQLTIGVISNEKKYTIKEELEFKTPLKNKTVSGVRIKKPYANTYLLTKTTTFDYVDILNDGPTSDDFGGWTKFNYRQAHSDYRFRAPYTGLFYNRGRLTDPTDDTGSMSSGIKEVKYLESIETKTHIAYFITNKTDGSQFSNLSTEVQNILTGKPFSTRRDGLGAASIGGGDLDPAATGGTPSQSEMKELEKLEKIVLYAKNDYSHPISITYFEYDQSLCKGIPNTSSFGTGKLTLKKVWTEGGGVAKTRIAPYQFKYKYFRDYSSKIKSKYPKIDAVFKHINTAAENPYYREGLLDMWGNYQINSEERFKNMQPWLDQTIEGGTNGYDPAAWQLKQIILPSGGSIHIQYEQKDYLYVQDKKAMIMTPLLSYGLKNTYISKKDDPEQNRYYIDAEKLNITNGIDLEKYKNELINTYITNHKKLYFKILFGLNEHNANLNSYGSDYISGYTTVSHIGIDNGKIYFQLGDNDIKKDKTLPRFLAYKRLMVNGYLNLTNNYNVANKVTDDDKNILAAAYSNDGNQTNLDNDNSDNSITDIRVDKQNFKKAVRKIASQNTFNFFSAWTNQGFKTRKQDVCKKISPQLSYFKLPTYHSKKGGGIRVKYLLSYDPGIETGDDMVYGSEYIYQLPNGLSSGVATNEPSLGREENALVDFLERKPQKKLNKVTKGRDSKIFEGPIGESLLPGASIGYSRVIVKNIHSGKTTTGYAINEYHTVKDFPMLVEYSDINKENQTYKKFNLSLPLGLINFDIHKAWVTQGYLFKINDMHGKPKSMSTYAKKYDLHTHNDVTYTARTTYNYTNLGEGIKSLVYNPTTSEFEIGYMRPGYEEDLTLFKSRVKDRINDFSLELDLNITLVTPPPITASAGLSYTYSENQFSQHVTSKVLRQKTYLLSTTSTVDGVTQTTENLAFNKHTGDPVLTRTFDGYQGKTELINTTKDNGEHNAHYYALNIPASWIYNDLAHKSKNNTNSNQLTANIGSIITYGSNPIESQYNSIENSINNFKTGSITASELTTEISNLNPFSANFNNVISASAVVLTKDWFNPTYTQGIEDIITEYDIPAGSVNNKLNNHYYPLRSYVFRDNLGVNHAIDFNNPTMNKNIYGGGTAITSLQMFPWTNTNFKQNNEVGNGWFSASQVNKYSPNGVPLEEEDALNISSTAHFSYQKTLPSLVAQNAKYKEVFFNDYESKNLEPGSSGQIVSNTAHSGSRSLKITNSYTQGIIQNYNISSDIIERGITIKLWLKSKQPNGLKNPNPNLNIVINGNNYSCVKIAQTGEWTLYESRINSINLGALSIGIYDINLSYNYTPGTQEEVYIDDVRIQPLDAVMNCTVYTKDNKVAAQFDDQHFGVFYEYNREGQLVRKSIETERGRKTIQEQQHNVPLKLK